MKSERLVNSEGYDYITVIASAAKSSPGYIRICSGKAMTDKQFRYSKCELFTAELPEEKSCRICMQDVKVHYAYLFRRDCADPVKQICPEKSGVSAAYKNQNTFHYSPPVGWLNDPVGLCFYRGLYHMFYQFNPSSQKWGDAHWGHVTSSDLLHWREHPVVLSPQPELVCNPDVRGGAFSGTALVEQNKMHLFFTRHVGDLQKEHCMEYTAAVYSENGFSFSAERIAVNDLPAELGENFRDPKVWREGDEWLMLTGSETADTAAIAVHCSKDLIQWQYKGIFLKEKDKRYLRAECPSIRKMADKYVLIAGYHNRDETQIRRDTVYYIGSIKNYRFRVEHKGLVDHGKDFYAAQIFANLKRTVAIAWINDRYEYHIEKLCRSNGVMSLPRKLWIEKGELYSYPVEEVERLETSEEHFENIFHIKDGRGHLQISLRENASGHIVLAESEAGQVTVTVCPGQIIIMTDKEKWNADITVERLDIYTDNALFEIFINGGMRAFTRRYERYETNYEVDADFGEGCRAVFRRIKNISFI